MLWWFGEEEVRLVTRQVVEAADVHGDAGGLQDQPGPRPRAAVREVALPVDQHRQQRQRAEDDGVQGDGGDQEEDRPPPVERGHCHQPCVRSAGRRGAAETRPSASAAAVGVAAVTSPSTRRALRLAGRLDVAAEDHLAGGGLQHAGDDDVDVLADHLAAVVDDHHRAVVQVGDALVVLAAFLEDEDLHVLARAARRASASWRAR